MILIPYTARCHPLSGINWKRPRVFPTAFQKNQAVSFEKLAQGLLKSEVLRLHFIAFNPPLTRFDPLMSNYLKSITLEGMPPLTLPWPMGTSQIARAHTEH
jgi:hypothetical protein